MTLVTVDVGACRCPGKPHKHDEVLMAPSLTNAMGAAAMAVLKDVPEDTAGAMQAALTQIYLSPAPAGGIVAWSFLEQRKDERGVFIEPVPVTSQNIERLIPWTSGGMEVAEKADILYAGDLFRPLAVRRSKASPPTPMDDSMSQPRPSGSTTRKSSKRSSPNGTAGMQSVAPAT